MKKQLIKNTMQLAQIMTLIESGKSQVKIGDAREFMSKLEKLDLLIQENGCESPLYAIYKKNKAKIMGKGVSKNAKVKLAKMMGAK